MDVPRRRRHYALGLIKVPKGWKVDYVLERPSRAEAEVTSLSVAARHERAEAVTVDYDIQFGSVLSTADVAEGVRRR